MDDVSLKLCSQCRCINYCSSECQRSDWNHHKALCKRLALLRPRLASRTPTADGALKSEWTRRLQSIGGGNGAAELLATTPRCNACLVAGDGVPLTPCERCHCAWKCTECDLAAHHCFDVARGRLLVWMMRKRECHPVLTQHATPPSVWGGPWHRYWDVHPLPEAITDATNQIVARGVTEHILSPAATLLHALSRLQRSATDGVSDLVVHVIGADEMDLYCMPGNEELLHSLPHVKSLTTVYVGPDLPSHMKGGAPHAAQCCPTCTAAQRTRSVHFVSGLWHEVRDALPTPHVCLALNSGCYDEQLYPSWRATLQALGTTPVVGVFTSYIKGEQERDASMLTQCGNKLAWCGSNPFASPLVQDDPGDVGECFAPNAYAVVFDNRVE